MLRLTPPAGVDYLRVTIVSYEHDDGFEHLGLALTLYRVGYELPESSGIFYEDATSVAERERKMREDAIALYVRAVLFEELAFVCDDERLVDYIRDGLRGVAYTERVQGSVLDRFRPGTPPSSPSCDPEVM